MYGFYISYNENNYKFTEGYDENISLEDAIKCIGGISPNGVVSKIDKYTIKNGQYGPYIEYNKKFFSIPKEYDVNTLTKEQCAFIIKIPKKVYKKK